MPCGLLRGVLKNQGPLKDTRRLSRVRPLGRDMTILMVLEVTVFNIFLSFFYEFNGYRVLIACIVLYEFDYE